MDFDFSASALLAGMFISAMGAGLFLYGKKNAKLFPLFAGIAMCIYPLFIYNPWLLWPITAAILVLLYLLREKE